MAANTCTIIKQALAIPGKNPKLISPLFFITFLLTFLLSYANQLSAKSLATGLTAEAPATSVTSMIALQLVFIVFSLAVNPVLKALNVYALAMTNTGKQLTLRELLRDAKSAIRRSTATQLLVLYPITFGYELAMAALLIFWRRVPSEQILLRGAIVVAGAAGVALRFWLAPLWAVTETVTVVEERWGMAAMKRAGEVVGAGVRTAVAIAVVANAVNALASLAPYVLRLIMGGEMGAWGEVGVQMAYDLAKEAINFVFIGAFAVFYYEFKWSRVGEEDAQGMTLEKKGGFYAQLPTADTV